MENISRQRKYQINKKKEKKCVICGNEAVNKSYCITHKEDAAKRAKQRYRNKIIGKLAEENNISVDEAKQIKGW